MRPRRDVSATWPTLDMAAPRRAPAVRGGIQTGAGAARSGVRRTVRRAARERARGPELSRSSLCSTYAGALEAHPRRARAQPGCLRARPRTGSGAHSGTHATTRLAPPARMRPSSRLLSPSRHTARAGRARTRAPDCARAHPRSAARARRVVREKPLPARAPQAGGRGVTGCRARRAGWISARAARRSPGAGRTAR
jgi:hypothetical protein